MDRHEHENDDCCARTYVDALKAQNANKATNNVAAIRKKHEFINRSSVPLAMPILPCALTLAAPYHCMYQNSMARSVVCT